MGKVLIVDDEEAILNFYKHIISSRGHEVFLARDVEQAKSAVLSNQDLDVSLVDRVLPGQEDGLSIIRFIQANQPFCHNILVSGYPTFSSASEALRFNAYDYLVKPVQKATLCQVIDAGIHEKSICEKAQRDAHSNKQCYDELKSRQAILQHDMRSLLIGIVGSCNRLMKKTSLDDIQSKYCRQIRECGIQLENMVNTYSDISGLERQWDRLEKTQFNLWDIVKQSRETLRFMADEKNVDICVINNNKLLSIDDDLPFQGNRMYLQNAMDNLVKNAIEASPPDKRVKIKIKHDGQCVSIFIHNWGTVPPDMRSRFFDKHATSGKVNGQGLGTYMAKLVVTANGGRITMNSCEDEGTVVMMTLPYPR
jgi:two-component system sensor histidine kinase/response regulator